KRHLRALVDERVDPRAPPKAFVRRRDQGRGGRGRHAYASRRRVDEGARGHDDGRGGGPRDAGRMSGQALARGTTAMSSSGAPIDVSVVVPVYNERPTLGTLFDQCRAALDPLGIQWELVFVDDGSNDGSFDEIEALQARDPRARGLRLRTNLGKAAALAVGFRAARGERLVTMDGDLQDDPAEIPRMLAGLDAGSDLVCGWKVDRQD